jgi:hypothetical protein
VAAGLHDVAVVSREFKRVLDPRRKIPKIFLVLGAVRSRNAP